MSCRGLLRKIKIEMSCINAGQMMRMRVNQRGSPRVHIRTYGCQMNEHDSEIIAGLLATRGYKVVDDGQPADIYVLNTCSVREHAEDRVRGSVNLLSTKKGQGGGPLIVLCGCMAQAHGGRLLRELPGLDVVCGTHRIADLPALIAESMKTGASVVDVSEDPAPAAIRTPRHRGSPVKAWVSIMRGCDNFCSYCIVPYVRGREVSRLPGGIVREVERLVDEGFMEVTLLGQNVNSYRGGESEDGGLCDFVRLLEMVNGITGLSRIRFVTSHPKDVSGALPGAISRMEKVCEHIHLPVQSGSNTVLGRMNRNYTGERYAEIVGKLREEVPGIAVTTDIIAGFPGETSREFDDTVSLIEEIRFDGAYIFKYSGRPHTAAAGMEDTVPMGLKKERLRKLIDLQMGISRKKNRALIGRSVEVLAEGESPKDPSMLIGRTRGNRVAVFPGGKEDERKMLRLVVTDANATTLYCRKAERKGRGRMTNI